MPGTARALLLTAVLVAVRQAAPAAEESGVPLPELLARLARRAALHESSLYRFQCIENILLRTYRKEPTESDAARLQEQSTAAATQRILVEKGSTGAPSEVRLGMTKDDGVRLDASGRPVEITLPRTFRPVERAFPHAQAAAFSAEQQLKVQFAFVDASERASLHRIECPTSTDQALEFLDREPPRRKWLTAQGTRCDARASGQMCLEPASGEITAIEFYGTKLAYRSCEWDFAHPFARIELAFTEPRTGIRFPTRVETVVPMGRDVGVFSQHFRSYDFSEVRTEQKSGPLVLQDPH